MKYHFLSYFIIKERFIYFKSITILSLQEYALQKSVICKDITLRYEPFSVYHFLFIFLLLI